jgi:hypothetical protein
MPKKKEPKTQKWAYKIIESTASWESDEPTLNELGQEGWECVSAVCQGETVAYVLKRPLEE